MISGQTLGDAIAHRLLHDIREGTYRPGDRLPTLKELMATYDISYGVAREAMRQLVGIGVVDVRPRRGAVVCDVDTTGLDDRRLAILLSDQSIGELYDLRSLLEVAVAGAAAATATEDQIAEIRLRHDSFEKALLAGGPVFQIDVELHLAIARISGNALFTRILQSLGDVLATVRAEAARIPGAGRVALSEHAAVIRAIAGHRPEAARAAMRQHIETAKVTVIEARSPAIRHRQSTRAPAGPRAHG